MAIDKKKLDKELDEDLGIKTGVEVPVREWVTSGNYALDWAISGKLVGGGFPVGRVVEIFGDPSTGKSVLLMNAMKATQDLGGEAFYDDPEQGYDEFFAKNALGVDVKNIHMADSEIVEEHFERVEKAVNKVRAYDEDVLVTFALDSLAMLSTKHEKETGFEKVDMFKAKLIRQGMRKLGGWFNKKRVLYLVSNHVIDNIGVMYGPKTTTPGGGGIKFQASVRVELNMGKRIVDPQFKDKVLGVHVRAEVVKNKVSPPFKKCEFDISFEKGVDKCSGMFDVLVGEGVFKEAGGWYVYQDEKYRRADLEVRLEEIIKEVK